MTIVLSANNREEVFVLPYAPPDIPIENGQDIDTYDGLSFNLTMPGLLTPRKLSWSAYYPNRRYVFTEPSAGTDPYAFADFIRKWRNKKYPLRLVITEGDRTVLNMAALVSDFSYSFTKTGNMSYSISLTEYAFIA